MSALHDVKLFERVNDWLDKADVLATDAMTSGNISDWGQYQRKVGYRRAIEDMRTVLKEEFDILMRE